jgi:hypothetical protein
MDWLFSRQIISMISVSVINCQVRRVVKGRVYALGSSIVCSMNTGRMDVGEGVLWRSKTEPTSFNTEQGKSQLAFSMLTCAQQIDTKIFAYMKHIRPRRALILDEQKQTVGTFPLFVHDGTRRGAAPDAPPGMLQNLVTMETFSVRGGLIHHVEAAPLVTLPYGLGNGWTTGSGR